MYSEELNLHCYFYKEALNQANLALRQKQCFFFKKSNTLITDFVLSHVFSLSQVTERNFSMSSKSNSQSPFFIIKIPIFPFSLGSWQTPRVDILFLLLHAFGWRQHVPLTCCLRDSK